MAKWLKNTVVVAPVEVGRFNEPLHKHPDAHQRGLITGFNGSECVHFIKLYVSLCANVASKWQQQTEYMNNFGFDVVKMVKALVLRLQQLNL